MEQFRKSRILYTGQTPMQPRRSRRIFRKPFFVIAGAFFFITGVIGSVYVLQRPTFRIDDITISGLTAIAEEKIRESVQKELSGATLFFLPNNSYFLISSRALQRKLYEQFPRLVDVKVKKTFHPSLEIAVIERDMWGIGCTKTEVEEIREETDAAKKSEPEKTVGPCFFIDKTGFAFEDVASFEGGLFPVIYTDRGGELGSLLFQEGDVAFFNETNRALEGALQLPLLSLEFSLKTPDDARLTLKEGWSLIVPRSKPSSLWLPVLRTFLANEIKERRRQLDYVDLRFGNKVFYKFR